MSLGLRYGARSDVGLLREGNEDSMYAGPRLLAVADGMGGHAAGEVASRVVIETVSALDAEPPAGDLTEALQQAVGTANGYLRDMVAADGALEGMGTTLTALLWVRQQLGLVHVGDSRAYLLRDGRLEMITHDHTLVQSLVDEGRITAEEATTHPQRSWITRALDGRENIELDLSMRDVRAGDRYLVCSDGLSSYVSEETIAEALGLPDPQAACDRLVDLALRAGGPDNVTCIVADLVDETREDGAPIVGGAAADDDRPTAAPDSPAARAAAVQHRPGAVLADPSAGRNGAPAGADVDSGDDEDDDRPAADSTGSRRLVLVLVGVLVLVAAGVVVAYVYIRSQYYVGITAGPPSTVAVYRGVSGSVLGIELSSVDTHTNLPVSALPGYERSKVESGYQASSRGDADRFVARLRQDACTAAASAAPTASPAPSPSPSKSATAKKSTTSKATSTSAHKASPTPAPLPSYCPATP